MAGARGWEITWAMKRRAGAREGLVAGGRDEQEREKKGGKRDGEEVPRWQRVAMGFKRLQFGAGNLGGPKTKQVLLGAIRRDCATLGRHAESSH